MDIIRENIPYKVDEDILTITTEPFYSQLRAFLVNYEKFILKKSDFQKDSYDSLPFLYGSNLEEELKYRRNSYHAISSLIKNKSKLNILEIAGWNGWLTHSLGVNENKVTCIDYFIDDTNGLSTKKFYKNPNWNSIQCDIEDPEIFNCKFDLIIFNHNVQFLSNPLEVIGKYKKYLTQNGKIVLLGLSIYKNNTAKKSAVETFRNYYTEKFNINVFFKPCRGFLDGEDKVAFKQAAFEFVPYRAYYFKNLLSKLISKRPQYFYAIFEQL